VVTTIQIILRVACACNVGVVRLIAKTDPAGFGMRVATMDSCFVLGGSPDPPTERETSPKRDLKIAINLHS